MADRATDIQQIVNVTHVYARGLDLFRPEEMAEQFHAITNHVIEFDGPDAAHGTNYVLAEGSTKDGATIKAAALNTDTYRRVGGTWLISGRTISPLTTPQMEGFEA